LISSVWDHVPKMHLLLDRTNWKFGAQDINYLVLAARIGKITFPLFWILLDHQGNSDTQARIDLLNRFKEAFGFDKILSFSADREFIGNDWLNYLTANKIPFFIRIKGNQLAHWGISKKPLKDFFAHLNTEETRHLYELLDDPRIFIVGKKLKDEYLIICSNVHNKDLVLKTYRQRWDIERLFRNMKTQGFNLENTHMKDVKRLSKLMAIVALAILVVSIVGTFQNCAYKKTVQAPLYSYFTRGLRWIKIHLLLFDFTHLLKTLQKSEG
jgi:hypothetical protein